MTKTFNFSNPMYGRKWLRLLHDDPVSGFRIQANLDLPARNLGFSFRSNSLGLRGPDDVHAPNVIFGTSYGMGFAVDNGQNWYEKALKGSWLNFSLPVGIRHLEALFNTYYQGPARTALVLYHPNIWVMTRLFELRSKRSSSFFKVMNWQTDFWPCLKLNLRRLRWRRRDIRNGELLVFRQGGLTYEVDTLYNRYNFDEWKEPASLVIESMRRMLQRFERVIVVRTLLKQDLVPMELQNSLLQTTHENHNHGWEYFQEQFRGNSNMTFHVTEGNRLDDFLPRDNHWTPQGNDKFARLIQELLQEAQGKT